MLTATLYSEAGGVGKTTLTANLGVALARKGQRVLLIDMDPQEGGLSHLLDADDDRDDAEADSLPHHLVGRGQGDFAELIREAEHGVDVVPSHNNLSRLGDWLDKVAAFEEETATEDDYEYPRHSRLRETLTAAKVYENYDVILVDPPATEGPHVYNALDATRNVIIPYEPSGKGQRSLTGLDEMVAGFEAEVGGEVGALAVVPNNYRGLNDQDRALERLDDLDYASPVVLRERRSMFEGCWARRCSAFTFVDEHRDRQRDHEMETLAKFDTLADHLAKEAGLVMHA